MKTPKSFISHSYRETVEFAKDFAAQLRPGNVLCLEGELGSGKTAFVKGVALGLGLKHEDEVKSPTFVLMHIYPTKIPVYHFDLYRLEGEADLMTIGLEEFAYDQRAVTCVEWADKAPGLFPKASHKLFFSVLAENSRKIDIG